MQKFRVRSGEIGRERKISEPHVCHLTHIKAPDKRRVFHISGLWFLDSDSGGKCGPIPDRRIFRLWSRDNVNEWPVPWLEPWQT
jgi:hypothetical protein